VTSLNPADTIRFIRAGLNSFVQVPLFNVQLLSMKYE